MRLNRLSFYIATMLSLFFLPTIAHATGSSGFELATNSARALGRGNAVTADPEEPAAVVFNPAGLTSLEGNQVSMSTSLITLSTDYAGANGGVSEDSATKMSTVPSFFMSMSTPVKPLKVGFGVNAPFGLATEYSSTGNFRYTAHYNMIKTVGYNLAAAYQVQDWLSLGVTGTYLTATTKQAGKVNNSFLAGVPLPDTDFQVDVDGDGWGMGFGAQIKPAERHFLGLFYRTQIRTRQTGEISVDNIPAALAGFYNTGGTTFNTKADTDVTFPGAFTLAYKYQINDRWDAETDFTWTRWSSFDRVDLSFERTSTILNALEPVNEGFHNTFTFNLGTSYKLNDIWTLSGGYWFYEMAANKAFYTGAIPDADRHALTLGVQYNRNNYSIHLSYVALFFTETSIDNLAGATNGAVVDGDYKSFANIISMDAVYKF